MSIEELEVCINTYGKDIYIFCKQLTCNLTEVEDLYQDTFLKAVEIMKDIHMDQNPKSYLLSITLRIWKNKKRKYAWRQRIARMERWIEEKQKNNVTGVTSFLEERVLANEEKNIVEREVKKLNDKYRIPIYLYYMEDLSLNEIAKLLKIPEGTVKSRLHKARKILKDKLEVIYFEE